jgi:uncharacterized BrkB/YihY/UPF0761 family membrane protein
VLARAAAARRYRAVRLALSIGQRDREAGGALLAGALAFRLFLWILPVVLVIVGFLGFTPPTEAADGTTEAGLGAFAAATVEEASSQAQRSRWVLLAIGLVTLYVASAQLARTLWVATTLAWQLPLAKMRGLPRAAGIVVSGFAVASSAAVAASWLRSHEGGWGMLATLAVVGIFAGLGWAALCLLPHAPDATPVDLLPGALVIGIGSQALHLFTVLYLADRATNELYGALGGAATLLLWGYLLARLLIGASTVNRTLHDERRAARDLAGITREG